MLYEFQTFLCLTFSFLSCQNILQTTSYLYNLQNIDMIEYTNLPTLWIYDYSANQKKQESSSENDHKYNFIYLFIYLIYDVYFDKHFCAGNLPTCSIAMSNKMSAKIWIIQMISLLSWNSTKVCKYQYISILAFLIHELNDWAIVIILTCDNNSWIMNAMN